MLIPLDEHKEAPKKKGQLVPLDEVEQGKLVPLDEAEQPSDVQKMNTAAVPDLTQAFGSLDLGAAMPVPARTQAEAETAVKGPAGGKAISALEPLVPATKVVPEPVTDEAEKAVLLSMGVSPTAVNFGIGALRAVAKTVEEMSRPVMAALGSALAIPGVGEVGGAAFAADMIRRAPGEVVKGFRALRRGDTDEAGEHFANAAINTVFAVGGAKAAARPLKAAKAEMEAAAAEWARAGLEAGAKPPPSEKPSRLVEQAVREINRYYEEAGHPEELAARAARHAESVEKMRTPLGKELQRRATEQQRGFKRVQTEAKRIEIARNYAWRKHVERLRQITEDVQKQWRERAERGDVPALSEQEAIERATAFETFFDRWRDAVPEGIRNEYDKVIDALYRLDEDLEHLAKTGEIGPGESPSASVAKEAAKALMELRGRVQIEYMDTASWNNPYWRELGGRTTDAANLALGYMYARYPELFDARLGPVRKIEFVFKDDDWTGEYVPKVRDSGGIIRLNLYGLGKEFESNGLSGVVETIAHEMRHAWQQEFLGATSRRLVEVPEGGFSRVSAIASELTKEVTPKRYGWEDLFGIVEDTETGTKRHAVPYWERLGEEQALSAGRAEAEQFLRNLRQFAFEVRVGKNGWWEKSYRPYAKLYAQERVNKVLDALWADYQRAGRNIEDFIADMRDVGGEAAVRELTRWARERGIETAPPPEAAVERETGEQLPQQTDAAAQIDAELTGGALLIDDAKYGPREAARDAILIAADIGLLPPEQSLVLAGQERAADMVAMTIEAGQALHFGFINQMEVFRDFGRRVPKAWRRRLHSLAEAMRRGEEPDAPAEVKQVVREIIRYWDEMRQQVVEYKKREFLSTIRDPDYQQAFAAVVDEELSVEQAVEQFSKVDADRLTDLVDAYREIEQWGLDEYVTNMERGSYRLEDENGVTRAVAMTKRDAVEKAKRLVREDPSIKELHIMTGYSFSQALDPHLVQDVPLNAWRAIVARIGKRIRGDQKEIARAISEELAKAGLRKSIRIKPTFKFAGPLVKRKGVLKGEEDLLEVLPAYDYAVRKKLALDPVIRYIREHITEIDDPRARKIVLDTIEAAKGKYYLADQVADILSRMVGGKGMLATRVSRRIRRVTAWGKLGYRVPSALVNRVSGTGHTWTQIGARYMMKAKGWLKTEEGLDFLRRNEPYLGVSFVEKAAGKLKTRIKPADPLYLFSAQEPPMRRLALAANYLYARERLGMTVPAAEAFARRQMRFQLFVYDVAALPRLLRGPVLGGVVGQFRSYIANETAFVLTLRREQMMRYIGMMLALGGPRAALWVLRSLPIIGTFVGLDWLESWLNRNETARKTSAGLSGMLFNVDISAPVAYQFPSRPEDWAGAFFSDVIDLYKTFVQPFLKGRHETKMTLPEWIQQHVVILRSWNALLDGLLSRDGWVRDYTGKKMYRLTSEWDALMLALGFTPLELNVSRSQLHLEVKDDINRREDRIALLGKIVNRMTRGQKVPDVWWDRMTLYGLDVTSIKQQYKRAELTPAQRRALATELRRRAGVLQRLQEAGVE